MLKEFELDAQGTEWKRLVNEVEMLRRLRHPHIVEVQAVFQSQRTVPPVAYVQLPFYARGDAARWLDDCAPEMWKRQRFLMQLAQALCHLHAHGFAHGDLKLENVLISDQARASTCNPAQPALPIIMIEHSPPAVLMPDRASSSRRRAPISLTLRARE